MGIASSMGGEEASPILRAAMASDAMRIPHRVSVGCNESRPAEMGELVQPQISHANQNMLMSLPM
uniref:Uncharacterized protein n=1 Tax=Oryza meridionalis TaxID=40149 RepID=A0A0E0ER74_9ORYZ